MGDDKEKVMQIVLQSEAKYYAKFREPLINSENVNTKPCRRIVSSTEITLQVSFMHHGLGKIEWENYYPYKVQDTQILKACTR